jgi:hypothetical protein
MKKWLLERRGAEHLEGNAAANLRCPNYGEKRKLIFIHVDDKWTRPSSKNPTPRQS